MLAARNGNPDAIKVLLEGGAKVNAKETLRGTTALMWAAEQKHPDGRQGAARGRRRFRRQIGRRGPAAQLPRAPRQHRRREGGRRALRAGSGGGPHLRRTAEVGAGERPGHRSADASAISWRGIQQQEAAAAEQAQPPHRRRRRGAGGSTPAAPTPAAPAGGQAAAANGRGRGGAGRGAAAGRRPRSGGR